MTTGPGRRGRRDNGLSAAAYAPTGDVDPRVGEHLLDALALAGIAAYLRPTYDQHPITRNTVLPSRPTDRLYVDRSRLSEARKLIDQLNEQGKLHPAPQMLGDESLDDRWAQIIADFHASSASSSDKDSRPWPADEDIDPTGEPESTRDSETEPIIRVRRAVPAEDEPTLLDHLERWDQITASTSDTETELEEGYTPPPPPPLPRLSREATVALIVLGAGVVLLFWPGLIGIDQELSMILGACGIIGGFIGLVLRLRDGTEEDEEIDPDDGAVV